MDNLFSKSHMGARVMSSYRINSTSCSSHRTRLGIGYKTEADISKTVSGLSSAIYLVNPGAPSDRERIVNLAEYTDSFIYSFQNSVLSGESPVWCTFNNPPLHSHILKRLTNAGTHKPERFVCNPVEGAGELCGIKYTGNPPQTLVFPPGANEVNWMTLLRGSTRMGMVAASTSDAKLRVPDLKYCGDNKHVAKHAVRRLSIWRSINHIIESTRSAGMVRYEPFSIGCSVYDNRLGVVQLKGQFERSTVYQGDHFSKETCILEDMCRGKDSDFWLAVDAVLQYKDKYHKDIRDELEQCTAESYRKVVLDWEDQLHMNNHKNGRRNANNFSRTERHLQAAILKYDKINEERKSYVLEFVNCCLSQEQRNTMYESVGSVSTGLLCAFADSLLTDTCRSAIWIVLHNILKQINFTFLHIIGYEAHRILIFKVLIPAITGLLLAGGGSFDIFKHGTMNLQLLKERVGSVRLKDMLSRSTRLPPAPSSVVADGRTNRLVSSNYSEYDIATLFGLMGCGNDNIPLSVNLNNAVATADANFSNMDTLIEHIVNNNIGKYRVAEKNKEEERKMRRRRGSHSEEKQYFVHDDFSEEDEEEESPDKEEDKEENEEGVMDGKKENRTNNEKTTSQGNAKRKQTRRNVPSKHPRVSLSLKRGSLLDDKSNDRKFVFSTWPNAERAESVETIQKALSTRHSSTRDPNAPAISTGGSGGGCHMNEVAEVTVTLFMNLVEKMFHMNRGSILNSVHGNQRTERGVYIPRNDCVCGIFDKMDRANCGRREDTASTMLNSVRACDLDLSNPLSYPIHTRECMEHNRKRDAMRAESQYEPRGVHDINDIRSRLQELIMDPASVNGTADIHDKERMLHNEKMLTCLTKNPIFNAVLDAERGDVGRYIVLSNICKFLNVAIACLVDGDLPMIAHSRIGKIMNRGQTKSGRAGTRKAAVTMAKNHGNAADAIINQEMANTYNYLISGHCPSPDLKAKLLPPCISQLKSIGVEKKRGSRSAAYRQNCDHSFCRMLKLLFFSIRPTDATHTFTDPASRNVLLKLDTLCRATPGEHFSFKQQIVDPIFKGSAAWVAGGEYTPSAVGKNDCDGDVHSPVDFYHVIKRQMVDENVVPLPSTKSGVHNPSVVDNAWDMYKEMRDCACESFRPELYCRVPTAATEDMVGSVPTEEDPWDELKVLTSTTSPLSPLIQSGPSLKEQPPCHTSPHKIENEKRQFNLEEDTIKPTQVQKRDSEFDLQDLIPLFLGEGTLLPEQVENRPPGAPVQPSPTDIDVLFEHISELDAKYGFGQW